MDKQTASKIHDEAREKISELIFGDGEYGWQAEEAFKKAVAVLSLSGTTDIECPECKGEGTIPADTPFSSSLPSTDCPKCDNGVIKHKWRIKVE